MLLFHAWIFYWEKDSGIHVLAGSISILIVFRQAVIILENKGLLKKYQNGTRELEINEQRYRSLFHNHPDAVFSIDLNGIFTSANHACRNLLGYGNEELAGKHFLSIVSDGNKETIWEHFCEATGGNPQKFEIGIKGKEGFSSIASFTVVPIMIGEQITGVFGIGKDITENKNNVEKIRHMAFHDLLTGLPNRRMFEALLKQAILEEPDEMHAIMIIDLDRFKIINDTLGHNLGDQLLGIAARRLEVLLSSNEVIGRQGGDEFVLLAKGVYKVENVIDTAEKIINALKKPFFINSHELLLSSSIGISIYPNDGGTVEELLKNADIAMYRVKENGKNGYRLYSAQMSEGPARRLTLEKDLYLALEHNQFIIHYQPQMDTVAGRMTGVEALLRWQHPILGMVSPAEFIPIAEETGVIIPISEWVLRTACFQAKNWCNAGYDIKVGVNLSPRHFYQKNLVKTIEAVLKETGLKPDLLDLEITEGIAAKDRILLNLKLTSIRSLGVTISVDDFGTGYSSLSYLTNFPIDTLKIAREFIVEVGRDPASEAIISSIITMAKNLNLQVIAEGVETEKQSLFLQSLNCSLMQGYLFSKPLAPEEVEKLLKEVRPVTYTS